MAQAIVDENRRKNIRKTALIEALEERRALFLELFAEALEDIALVNAIKEWREHKSGKQGKNLQNNRGESVTVKFKKGFARDLKKINENSCCSITKIIIEEVEQAPIAGAINTH